jgi:hypothetical protein
MSTATPSEPELLAYPPKIAAQKLGRSVSTLALWRSLGIGPAFARSPDGRGVWYTDDALVQFLRDQEVKELARRAGQQLASAPPLGMTVAEVQPSPVSRARRHSAQRPRATEQTRRKSSAKSHRR